MSEQIDEMVTVPKKQYEEVVEKLASETQSKANLVSEIKELREKKQLTEAEAEDLRKKLAQRAEVPADGTALTPDQIVALTQDTLKSALAAKEADEAKANRVAAMNAFLSKHKEFHPDNDEGGIKLAALERKFAQFNTEGLKTQSEFLSVLDDAAKLIGVIQQASPSGFDPNPPAPSGTGSGTPAPEASSDVLTPKEINIINQTFNGDKERYLKIKQKRPDYVASLLQYSL